MAQTHHEPHHFHSLAMLK